jgi:hypothetical protein
MSSASRLSTVGPSFAGQEGLEVNRQRELLWDSKSMMRVRMRPCKSKKQRALLYSSRLFPRD